MAFIAIQVRLEDEERERLDAYRRAHADPPSRAVAAKRLLRDALFTVSTKPVANEATR